MHKFAAKHGLELETPIPPGLKIASSNMVNKAETDSKTDMAMLMASLKRLGATDADARKKMSRAKKDNNNSNENDGDEDDDNDDVQEVAGVRGRGKKSKAELVTPKATQNKKKVQAKRNNNNDDDDDDGDSDGVFRRQLESEEVSKSARLRAPQRASQRREEPARTSLPTPWRRMMSSTEHGRRRHEQHQHSCLFQAQALSLAQA